MKPERWGQIERLYNQALEIEESQRTTFLREACAGDDDLRQELEQLLAEGRHASSFLEEPALREIAHEFAATAAQSWIGRQLGNYQFASLVGAGGMGEVYRARDTKLKRDVAIKVLPEEFSTDPDRVSRFQREAQLLASLNHPNIAAIHDLEEADGLQFLILELVEGETLADRLKRGPIRLDDALQIATQIADGLAAAHDRGIIHRDLKPANIKLTAEGKVKVLDFGLAKAFESEAADVNLSNSPTKMPTSMPGTILGTAAYMSPEQANGAVLDRRTDIFAFGAVLYEMLAGQRAFPGETAGDILAAVIRAEPDWSKLPADTPSGIRRLLRRCLAKDRNRRLQTAGDARIEMDEARTEPDEKQNVLVTPFRSRERFFWLVVTLILLAAALSLGIPYFRTPTEALEMRVEITTPTTNDPFSFAISPDGRTLVFVASGDGQARLWLRPLDATTAQPLAGTQGAVYPFWSPDSRALGFFADGKLKRIDIGGGAPHTLATVASGFGGTWNPDGMILFAAGSGGSLYSVRSSGGEAAPVTKLDPPRQVSHRFPQFLPDGQRFLFFVVGTPNTQGIYLGALDSPQTQRLTAADSAGAYMPPGWLLFLSQGTLAARHFDLTRSELTGDPITVADPVDLDGPRSASALSTSVTGILAYRSSGAGRRQLTWFDRAGTLLGTLGAPDENGLVAPSLSPDGRRAVAFRTVQNNTDIWIFDATKSTRFTFDAGLDRWPIWSPDGNHIAFDSNRTGHRFLYQKRSDLAGPEIPLLESPEDKALNDWSPDGRFLLYITPSNPKTGSDIWYLPLSGDRKPISFVQTAYEERASQFSPDGHWVAYHSNESGPYQVYVRPFPGPGGQWQVSMSGGIQARWRPDGKELYYIAPDGKLMAASIQVNGAALEPGVPVALFKTRIWGGGTNATNNQQYDVAPDGRFLINITTEDAAAAPITLLLNWKPLAK